MKIEINFKKNNLAINLCNANKTALNSSILDCLKSDGGPAPQGQSIRIPTTHYSNNSSIKALNFIIANITEENCKLILESVET